MFLPVVTKSSTLTQPVQGKTISSVTLVPLHYQRGSGSMLLHCCILIALQNYTFLKGLTNLKHLELFQDWPLSPEDTITDQQNSTRTLSVAESQEVLSALQDLSQQLVWLNLPITTGTMALLPLIDQTLRSLNQLFLQVAA